MKMDKSVKKDVNARKRTNIYETGQKRMKA